jgi:hypothetical protein
MAVLKLTNSVNGAGGEVLSFTPRCSIHPAMSSTNDNQAQIKYAFPVVAEMDDKDNYDFQATSNADKKKDFAHEFEAMPPDATDPVAVVVLVDDEGNDRYWGWFKILENNATGQGNVKLGTRDLELFLPPIAVRFGIQFVLFYLFLSTLNSTIFFFFCCNTHLTLFSSFCVALSPARPFHVLILPRHTRTHTQMPDPPGDAEKADEARLSVVCYDLGQLPDDLFGTDESSKAPESSGESKKKDEDTNKKGEKAKSSGMEGDPFIEIDHGAPPAAPLFNPGDGFDVYIDAGRFLPDNTTIPKVVARVMTHDLEFVAMSNEKNQETAVCDLTDNVFNPQWKLRLEYRRGKDSAEKKFDPTSTLNIRVETIEELSKKVEVIGYCALNVFCKPGTADAPDNPSEREYVLNKGAHQLPLFYGAPNMKSEWSVHNLEGHPHVPCATLLVRIESAAKSDEDETKILSVHDSGVEKTQWEELGLLKPFKGYKEGDYDSQRCLPTETEKALYEVRRKQEAKSLRDRAIKAKRSDKVDKWDEKTVSDEDLQKWCTERTNQKPTDMLHPQGMVIYTAEAGFDFKVVGLFNIKKKKAHKQICKVIFCTNPPGAYYSDPKLLEDVHATMRHDWKSGTASQKYLDDWTKIRGMELTHNSTMLLEVKALSVKPGKKKTDPVSGSWFCFVIFVESDPFAYPPVPSLTPALSRSSPFNNFQETLVMVDVGWTVMPLFDAGTILSGYYQLPIYQNVPPPAFVHDSQTEEAEKILEDCLAGKSKKPYAKQIKMLEGGAQVLVHLVDALMHDMEANLLSTPTGIYLPKGKEKYYKYDTKQVEKDAKSDGLSKKVGKKQKAADWQKKLNELFVAETKIEHYDLEKIAKMAPPSDKTEKPGKKASQKKK